MVADAMICSNIMSFYTIIFTLPFTSVRTVSGALFFLCFYLSTTTVELLIFKNMFCANGFCNLFIVIVVVCWMNYYSQIMVFVIMITMITDDSYACIDKSK